MVISLLNYINCITLYFITNTIYWIISIPTGGMAPPSFPSVIDIQPTLNPSPPCPSIQPDQPAFSPPKPTPTGATKPDPHPNIVFDLNLDLQELEAMDLGVLEDSSSDSPPDSASQHQSAYGDIASRHQSSTYGDLESASRHQSSTYGDIDSASHQQTPTYGDIDMDVELTDWLEVLTNNNTVANANQPRTCSYNQDPLMPSMDSGQETLDMFSLDNLDFKMPSDSNLLSWDKIDYAT